MWIHRLCHSPPIPSYFIGAVPRQYRPTSSVPFAANIVLLHLCHSPPISSYSNCTVRRQYRPTSSVPFAANIVLLHLCLRRQYRPTSSVPFPANIVLLRLCHSPSVSSYFICAVPRQYRSTALIVMIMFWQEQITMKRLIIQVYLHACCSLPLKPKDILINHSQFF